MGDVPAGDHQELLRVAGAKFARRGSSATWRNARRGGTLARSGALGRHLNVAASTLSAAARSRPQGAAGRRRGLERQGVEHPSATKRVGARGVVTGGCQGRAEVVAPEVEAEKRVAAVAMPSAPSRWRLSACACGRSTSNQRVGPPPKRRARPS